MYFVILFAYRVPRQALLLDRFGFRYWHVCGLYTSYTYVRSRGAVRTYACNRGGAISQERTYEIRAMCREAMSSPRLRARPRPVRRECRRPSDANSVRTYVRTYVRAYVRSFVRACVGLLGFLFCPRANARTYVRISDRSARSCNICSRASVKMGSVLRSYPASSRNGSYSARCPGWHRTSRTTGTLETVSGILLT